MKRKRNIIAITKYLLLALFIALFIVACSNSGENGDNTTNSTTNTNSGSTEVNTTDQATTTGSDTTSGYPGTMADAGYPGTGVEMADSGYPGAEVPENTLSELPNPERDVPAPSENLGSVGGVLIREVDSTGFLPVTPQALYLGKVLNNNQGQQVMIAQGDDSPKAELLPTGVFVFNNIEPGTYGIVIDIGVSQFPLTGEDGKEMLIEVEPNKALDLGQVIVKLPNS